MHQVLFYSKGDNTRKLADAIARELGVKATDIKTASIDPALMTSRPCCHPRSLSTTIPPAILSILYFHLNKASILFISSIEDSYLLAPPEVVLKGPRYFRSPDV